MKKIAHFTQFQGEYQSEYIKTFLYICFGYSPYQRDATFFKKITLREEIFCGRNFYGRNFCGIYFCDFDPYSQKFLLQKKSKLINRKNFFRKILSKLINRKNFFRKNFQMMPFETVWLIDIFCRKIKRILLCFK